MSRNLQIVEIFWKCFALRRRSVKNQNLFSKMIITFEKQTFSLYNVYENRQKIRYPQERFEMCVRNILKRALYLPFLYSNHKWDFNKLFSKIVSFVKTF